MNTQSIILKPISPLELADLETWLWREDCEIALDQEVPEGWERALESDGNWIVRHLDYQEPTPQQKKIGFLRVPGEFVLSVLSRGSCIPLVFDSIPVTSDRYFVLVKKK